MTDATTLTAKEQALAAIAAAKTKKETATPVVATSAAAQTATTDKKLSPKNKASRGIDPSLVTTWVPLDLSKEDNTTLQNAAKHFDVNVGNMMADLLKNALKTEWAKIEDAADKYEPKTKAGKSIDDKLAEMDEAGLEAFVAKQEQAMATLRAKIAAAAQKIKG